MSNPPIDPNQQREFRCEHCEGLIRIPAHLPPTTGPCPHCGGTITSPANPSQIREFPSVEPSTTETPAAGEDAPGNEADVLKGEHSLQPNDQDEEQAWLERAEEDAEDERRRSLLPAALVFLVVACVVTTGIILAVREMNKQAGKPADDDILDQSISIQQSNYIRTGWKREAYQVLGDFINARNVSEKIPLVLHGDGLAARMSEFYKDHAELDLDTPAEAFSIYDLPESDRRKGIFMLVFDQPPQLDMRNFFRPVASLEVQYGLTQADLLLSSMALISNFSMEPVRVQAFFLKTDQGLKLDWEIFAQTKYRLLRNFVENPEIGKSAVFRVFIAEDVPDRGLASSTHRTYRLADPANMDDGARVLVNVDSDIGRILSPLNWIEVTGASQHNRTATVELEWREGDAAPQLTIKRFICWEFLGLGGAEATQAPHASGIEGP